MKTLAENPLFLLLHDEGRDWLFVEWRGKQGQENILSSCAIILEHVRRTGCPKILSDSTRDLDGWAKLTNWIAEDYFQQLAANGVVAVAWVLPTNLRARADVQKVVAAISLLITDVFADTEAAFSWLNRWPVPGRRVE